MAIPLTRRSILATAIAAQQVSSQKARGQSSQTPLAQPVEELLRTYVKNDRFAGAVSVAYEGKPIYRAAFGLANREWKVPNTADTCFRIGSVTKPFTATLVLQAVEDGLLRLDGSVVEYLSSYPKATGERITVHHLLSHTSGLIDYPDVPGLEYRRERLRHSRDEMLALFADAPPRFAPGSDCRYSNFGYFLLAVLLEQVTGKNYAALLQQRILNPLGMRQTSTAENKQLVERRAAGYYMQDGVTYNALPFDTSIVMGAGDILSTADDLLRYDQALYTDQLLPEQSRKLLFTPKLPEKDNYAYGWYVSLPGKHPGPDWARHSGSINGFSSLLLRLPESRHTIILLANLHGVQTTALGDAIKNIILAGPR